VGDDCALTHDATGDATDRGEFGSSELASVQALAVAIRLAWT